MNMTPILIPKINYETSIFLAFKPGVDEDDEDGREPIIEAVRYSLCMNLVDHYHEQVHPDTQRLSLTRCILETGETITLNETYSSFKRAKQKFDDFCFRVMADTHKQPYEFSFDE